MRTAVILKILDGVEHLPIDDAAKRQVLSLVRDIGMEHGIKGVERAERITFVQSLRQANVSRSTVVQRLMAHFHISKAQAHRVFNEALKLSQTLRPYATRKSENEVSDGESPLLTVPNGGQYATR